MTSIGEIDDDKHVQNIVGNHVEMIKIADDKHV